MYILFINGETSGKTNKCFDSLTKHVSSILKKICIEPHFETRTIDELNDFLSPSVFDRIDLIIYDGPVNASRSAYTPWDSRCECVYSLLNMCGQSGKAFFGTRFAALLLSYVCSTGGQNIRIVNGGGHGQTIDEIKQISSQHMKTIRDDDYFLENKYGDVYTYNRTDESFQPYLNCGVRLHAVAMRIQNNQIKQTSNDGSSFTVPHGVDTPMRMGIHKNVILNDTKKEILVKFRANSSHHWLCEGLKKRIHAHSELSLSVFEERSFLAPIGVHEWDITDYPTKGSVMSVLADGTCGPSIIEYGHMMAVSFAISSTYPITMFLLETYLIHKFELMVNYSHIEFSSQTAYEKAQFSGKTISEVTAEQPQSNKRMCVTDSFETLPKYIIGGGKAYTEFQKNTDPSEYSTMQKSDAQQANSSLSQTRTHNFARLASASERRDVIFSSTGRRREHKTEQTDSEFSSTKQSFSCSTRRRNPSRPNTMNRRRSFDNGTAQSSNQFTEEKCERITSLWQTEDVKTKEQQRETKPKETTTKQKEDNISNSNKPQEQVRVVRVQLEGHQTRPYSGWKKIQTHDDDGEKKKKTNTKHPWR